MGVSQNGNRKPLVQLVSNNFEGIYKITYFSHLRRPEHLSHSPLKFLSLCKWCLVHHSVHIWDVRKELITSLRNSCRPKVKPATHTDVNEATHITPLPAISDEIIPQLSPNTNSQNLRARRTQHVLSRSQRARFVRCMVSEAQRTSPKSIASRAVRNFPSLFRGNQNANLVRASRLWKSREKYADFRATYSHRGSATTITWPANIALVWKQCQEGVGIVLHGLLNFTKTWMTSLIASVDLVWNSPVRH